MGNFDIYTFVWMTAFLSTFCRCIVIEKSLELNGHKSAIYISQGGNPKSNKFVYSFKNISENIGVYGVFSYRNNYNLANNMKIFFENVIEQNVGHAMDWKSLLEQKLSDMEQMLREKYSEDLEKEFAVVVIVADKNKATQARWVPIPDPKISKILCGLFSSKGVYKNVTIFDGSVVGKILHTQTGLLTTPNMLKQATVNLKTISNWKNAAKVFVDIASNKKNQDICTIAIKLIPRRY